MERDNSEGWEIKVWWVHLTKIFFENYATAPCKLGRVQFCKKITKGRNFLTDLCQKNLLKYFFSFNLGNVFL